MEKEQIYQWFISDGGKSKHLDGIRVLNQDRDKWLIELDIPDDKTSHLIDSTARDPAALYSSTKSSVKDLLSSLTCNSSKAKSVLDDATKARDTHTRKRQFNIARKFGAGVQDLLCCISDFLQAFSGVADIVLAADQQFGGLAYGTIKLLVVIAARKRQREEAIEEALKELAYAFPRLDTLKRLRPKESLLKLIAEVFELAINFCRETITYFSSTLGRFAKSLNPKELKLMTLSKLRISLLEVSKECEVMMLEELADATRQISEMKIQLGHIQTTGNDTNDRVCESQHWMERSDLRTKEVYLSDLRQLLGLSPPDPTTSDAVLKYNSILTSYLKDYRRKRKSPRQMSWAVLKDEETFVNWFEGDKSAVLLLGGSNMIEDSSTQLNWLSFASILVIQESMDRLGKCPIFSFCQTSNTVTRRRRRRFPDVLHNLIYQLAMQHPNHLWAHREDVANALQSTEWQGKDRALAFEYMAQLLVKLAAAFDQGTSITIVIDRLDQCSWSDDPSNESNDLDKAVELLSDVVKDSAIAHICIKVLLVMDNDPALKVADNMKYCGGHFTWRINWEQEADEDMSD